MREAVIVSSSFARAVGKAPRGTLALDPPRRSWRPSLSRARSTRVPQLDANEIDDVIIGCAMPEAEQGMNVARIASLCAPVCRSKSAAMTINRFCASGLQAIALAAERIRGGGAEVIVAGGDGIDVDGPDGRQQDRRQSLAGGKLSRRRIFRWASRLSEWRSITAYRGRMLTSSRSTATRRRLPPIAAGKFDDEIVPVPVTISSSKRERQAQNRSYELQRDEGPRADTSLEALAKLKPVFHAKGIVTAGNSSQTSDGAAAAVVMSAERAAATGHQAAGALCRFRLCRMRSRRNGHRAGLCGS